MHRRSTTEYPGVTVRGSNNGSIDLSRAEHYSLHAVSQNPTYAGGIPWVIPCPEIVWRLARWGGGHQCEGAARRNVLSGRQPISARPWLSNPQTGYRNALILAGAEGMPACSIPAAE